MIGLYQSLGYKSYAMNINYFKTSIRHFTRQKLTTLINISGLALGVTCLLLAVLYWVYERGYDRFHQQSDQLYRITTSLVERQGGDYKRTGGTGQVQGPAFKASVPEVLDYVRLLGGDIYGDVRYEDKVQKLQMLFVDDNFLELFDFPAIQGDPATALEEINAVVISERTALRFFNTTDAVGKLLHLDADPSAKRLGFKPMQVTAVVKDPPANSSIQFDVLFPFRFLQLSFDDKNWLNAYLGTFVLLDEQADLTATVQKFDRIYAENAAAQLKEINYDPDISYGLQPIADLHLNSLIDEGSWQEGGTVNGSKPAYSNLFFGIACFIFLLAGINFVNINLASSLKRAREVGIRKIIGSSRRRLIAQFMGEAALLCGFSLFMALLLTVLLLPAFNTLADKAIPLDYLVSWQFGVGLFGVFAGTTLVSGLYPAVVLSSFKPGEVLYNRNQSIGQFRMGKGLVVLQFSLAFLLAVSTMVYQSQLSFIYRKDLGYDPGLIVRTNIEGNREYAAIKQLLSNEIGRSKAFAGIAFGGDYNREPAATDIGEQTIQSVYQSVDQNYLSVLGIKLQQGRNFNTADNREILVNETFVREAGLKDPIGAAVQLHPDFGEGTEPYQIVGVMTDYHYKSLHQPIQPIVLYQRPWRNSGIWLKIRPGDSQRALREFETLYQKAMPGASYTFHFLTDLVAREYEREQRWKQIISIAAGLALLICCLGLFGISYLHVTQRTKEIGIRKILGATTAGLVRLLSGNFLKLVLFGLIISTPVAYYLLGQWLRGYAYRVEISGWIFVWSGVVSVSLALAAVSIHCIRAARANPVESLSNE